MAEIAGISQAWNRLAESVPFRGWQWLGSWWREYGEGAELFVLAVFGRDGQLVGLAPWYVQDCSSRGRVVRFLGGDDACSDYLSIIAPPNREAEVAGAVAGWLLEDDWQSNARGTGGTGCWDLLELSGVWPDDPLIGLLLRHMARAGCTLHEMPGPSCWRIPLPAAWDDYLSQLSKPNRRRMRRSQRRLRDPDCQRRVAVSPAELRHGWQVLVDLHQQRRKSLGQPGCFASGRFERFLFDAAEQLLDDGRLRLSWVEIDGHPVGSMIGFVGNDVTYAYQMGISSKFLHESPGWLVQAGAIKEAMEHGCTSFDLLRGDEPYKGHVGAQPRTTVNIRVVPKRIAPRLRHSAWLAGNVLKSVIKTGLTHTRIW